MAAFAPWPELASAAFTYWLLRSQADLDLNNNDLLNVSGIYVGGVNVLNVLDNVTVSTASPTGGNDGDIWFKVSS